MFTCVAVLITGLYFILTSQQRLSSTLTLVVGIVVAALAVLDLLGFSPARRGTPPQPPQ